jgi:2,5-diketo-D-gluconate reductase B
MDEFRLGFGTYQLTGTDVVPNVTRALEEGYRHIDTAQEYGNEAGVGEAIAESSVPRDEVFLATKVELGNYAHDDVLESTAESLERLDTDYVDLLYVHWPGETYDAAETLPAFDELIDGGTVRHVGLSNFTPELLAEARDTLEHDVFAHQIERHVYLQQRELVAEAAEHDTRLVGYSPIAQGDVLDDPTLHKIADRRGATPVQVALAWHLRGERTAAIPKARGEHVAQNWGARDVALTEADAAELEALDEGTRTVDPDFAPWNDG